MCKKYCTALHIGRRLRRLIPSVHEIMKLRSVTDPCRFIACTGHIGAWRDQTCPDLYLRHRRAVTSFRSCSGKPPNSCPPLTNYGMAHACALFQPRFAPCTKTVVCYKLFKNTSTLLSSVMWRRESLYKLTDVSEEWILHLQGRRITQARRLRTLGLSFDPEDGGSTFLQKNGSFLRDSKVSRQI
jgi:hypothetical protein